MTGLIVLVAYKSPFTEQLTALTSSGEATSDLVDVTACDTTYIHEMWCRCNIKEKETGYTDKECMDPSIGDESGPYDDAFIPNRHPSCKQEPTNPACWPDELI